MNVLVYGVGFNDKTYPAMIDGKHTTEYKIWSDMLRRCYCDNAKMRPKNQSYFGCSVSDNFLNYTYFYEWCNKQVGFGKESFRLDKDIISKGNKIYDESICVFVPNEINVFFTDSAKTRGEYPVGVDFCKSKDKYRSRCTVHGKNTHLGYFSTPQEAFLKYKSVKEALCKQLALKWQHEIDHRVFEAMMKWEVNYETPSNI